MGLEFYCWVNKRWCYLLQSLFSWSLLLSLQAAVFLVCFCWDAVYAWLCFCFVFCFWVTTCNVFNPFVPLGFYLETRFHISQCPSPYCFPLSKHNCDIVTLYARTIKEFIVCDHIFTVYIHIPLHKLISKSSDLQPSSPTPQIVAQSIKRAPHPFRHTSF